MKTTNNNLPASILKISFLAMLLIVGACKDKSATAQQSSSQTKAPSVDIHTAVVSGNIDALKQHIAAGTNINEKDPYGGSSPLISASLFGQTEIAKILIDSGADINIQNNDGSTALHVAAFFCRPEIVKMLLEKKADKAIRNNFSSTAYESVAGSFSDVKSTYEMMEKMLGPMGLKLDFAYVEKTRPVIAAMLK